MNISNVGFDLIKFFEGLRLIAYKDSVGVLTIGYGHTSAAGEPRVTEDMKITLELATEILRRDLKKYEDYVSHDLIKDANQNQFDAMVSLCYNIGPSNFLKSSVLRYHNTGDFVKAADSFKMWNKAGGKILQGLVSRRTEEAALYSTPVVVEEKSWLSKVGERFGLM